MGRHQSQPPLSHLLDAIENNPLTRRLHRFDTDQMLASAMEHNPFAGGLSGVEVERRIPLVDAVRRIVAVTPTMLLAARGLHDALFSSLDRQNPLDPANRQRVYESGSHVGKPLSLVPWNPEFAGGLVLAGVTGTGKSHTAARFLQLVPQVVVHEGNDARDCGCLVLRQLVWMKVHMPSDGSRGGLVTSMLMAIDDAIQTRYLDAYGRWSIEKQLVAIIHVLVAHRCGLVVIEESQEENLAGARFGREFVQFFLRLLNAGMAVAVLGNPLAFADLMASAQNESRLTEFGWFEFNMASGPLDSSWCEDLVPGVWTQAQLLDQPDAKLDGLNELLFSLTGGLPRYLARLRIAALKLGLRTGEPRVTRELIEAAAKSPAMRGVAEQIRVFASKDAPGLARWIDVPADAVLSNWNIGAAREASLSTCADTEPVGAGRESLKKKEQKVRQRRARTATAPPVVEAEDAGDYRKMEFEELLGEELRNYGSAD